MTAHGALLAFSVALVLTICAVARASGECKNFAISNTQSSATDVDHQAFLPCVSSAPDANRYLVVWHADKFVDTRFEVLAQLYDGQGHKLLASEFVLSQTSSSPASTDYDAFFARAEYSSTSKLWLVIFLADVEGFDNAFEIFGQLLDTDAKMQGPRAFRISTVGEDDTNVANSAGVAELAWNSDDDEFLVVYTSSITRVNKVYGQRVSPAGELVGSSFRISYQNAHDLTNSSHPDVLKPRVVYGNGEYVVVFAGDVLAPVHGWDIYSQAISRDGVLTSAFNQRVSFMGADDTSIQSRAYDPVIAYNRNAREYLVAWFGDDDKTGVAGLMEVQGARLDSSAMLLGGANGEGQFIISRASSERNDKLYDSTNPRASWDSTTGRYVVCFDQDEAPHDEAIEIKCRTLTISGTKFEQADVRVSFTTGDARDPLLPAGRVDIPQTIAGTLFVVFQATETPSPFGVNGDGGLEIHGALVRSATLEPITGSFCNAPSSSRDRTGLVAGAVIGAVIGLALILGIIVYVFIRLAGKKRAREAAAAKRLAASDKDVAGETKQAAGRKAAASAGRAVSSSCELDEILPVSKAAGSSAAKRAEAQVPRAARAAATSPVKSTARSSPATLASKAASPAAAAKPSRALSRKKVSRKRPSRKPTAAQSLVNEYSYTLSYEYYDGSDVAGGASAYVPSGKPSASSSASPAKSPAKPRAAAPVAASRYAQSKPVTRSPAASQPRGWRASASDEDMLTRSYD